MADHSNFFDAVGICFALVLKRRKCESSIFKKRAGDRGE